MGSYHQHHSIQPQQHRADWIRENANLKKFSALLDRDVQGFYTTRSDLRQEAAAILERERGDQEARGAEAREVQKRLHALKAAMSRIKLRLRRLLEGAGVAGDLDVVMERLEDELYGFKCKMRKDSDRLVATEKALWTEVDDLRSKVKEWENAAQRRDSSSVPAEGGKCRGAPGVNGVVGEGSSSSQEKPADGSGGDKGVVGDAAAAAAAATTGQGSGYGDMVERINDLIRQEGGATGGWPQHEHDCFLRLWTQVKRGPSSGARPPPSSPADRAAVSYFVQRASTLLPARAAEEVREHLAWLARHHGYLTEKKRIVRNWREGRRQDQKTPEDETPDPPKGVSSSVAAEKERKAAAQERERKRKEVEEWRAAKEKAEQKRMELEERRRSDAGARADEERRRQRRVHEQVAAYRLEREREDGRRKEVERMLAREQRRHSQTDLDERVKRDVDSARRRRQEASLREGERLAAEEKAKAAASERWAGVAADRARLLKATKASKERVLDPEDLDDLEDARANRPAHCSRVAMNGRDLRFVGRAVPTWRRGLS